MTLITAIMRTPPTEACAQAILETGRHRGAGELPKDLLAYVKQGASEAGHVALEANDLEVLDHLARKERRITVLRTILQNPHVTEEITENVFLRALALKHKELQAEALRELPGHRLYDLLPESDPSCHPVQEVLRARIMTGDLDATVAANDSGWDSFFRDLGGYWMPPEGDLDPSLLVRVKDRIKEENLAYLFAGFLRICDGLTVEEFAIGQKAVEATSPYLSAKPERRRLQEESLNSALSSPSSYLRECATKPANMPEGVFIKNLETILPALTRLSAEMWHWTPAMVGALAPHLTDRRVADILSYVWVPHGAVYEGYSSIRSAVGKQPVEFFKAAVRAYGGARFNRGVLRGWATGALGEAPSNEDVLEVLQLARQVHNLDAYEALLNAINARSRGYFYSKRTPLPVSGLADEYRAANLNSGIATEGPLEVAYASERLGTNVAAWKLFLTMGTDWSGKLSELLDIVLALADDDAE